MAGLVLDPWEELVVRESLGERANGKWAAFEVAVVVSRQNGKGAILEARELAGLFLLNEGLIIHSAHLFDTSLEAFRRLLFLIENTPDLDKRVKRVSRTNGNEGIEIKGGPRIRFRARTKGGGRGFTADCVVFDEAMDLPEMAHGAILPTLSARPNPQVWYTGSAVDQNIQDHSVVFARIRERGHRGDDPALAYFEWSADHESPERVDDTIATDPVVWAQANPGLGIRISAEYIANEQRAMDPRTFAVERLGVGDWPRTDGFAEQIISDEVWAGGEDAASEALDPVCLAFDVTPDRSATSVSAAGKRGDGRPHVELIAHRRGTGWVAQWLTERVAIHSPVAVLCDATGPAAALLPQLEELGVEVETVNAREHAQAAGVFFDACEQGQLRHIGQTELTRAVKGAVARPLGEAWAWSRKTSAVDISPLVACTLALWGLETQSGSPVNDIF